MKQLFTLAIALFSIALMAQQKPNRAPFPKKSVRNLLPPQTYRLEKNSDLVYSEIDNMPIMAGQTTMTISNATPPPHKDTTSIYRMPNPLYRNRSMPKKP